MIINSFTSVIDFLNSFTPLNPGDNIRENRLLRMSLLLSHFNNPENSFKAIHIAGSKGKGSMATFLANAITARGYKCGLFTSPHVYSYKERFTLSGEFFSDEVFIKLGNYIQTKLESFSLSEEMGIAKPTNFELYTLLSYLLFKEAGCEYAVIETGLGGRLDSTNTLNSLCSIIMIIELEHTQILGSTLSQIALEKAKIIKEGQKVFTTNQNNEVLDVIKKEAREKNSELIVPSYCIENREENENGQHFILKYKDSSTYNINMKMRTKAQSENLALAITVLKELNLFDEEKSIKALENTQTIARFQTFNYKGQSFVLDTAHTKTSMKNTIDTFSSLYKGDKTIIFALLADKDIQSMKDIITDNFSCIILSKPGDFKVSNMENIYNCLKDKHSSIHLLLENNKALEKAINENNPTLICGSFYLAEYFYGVFNELK